MEVVGITTFYRSESTLFVALVKKGKTRKLNLGHVHRGLVPRSMKDSKILDHHEEFNTDRAHIVNSFIHTPSTPEMVKK